MRIHLLYDFCAVVDSPSLTYPNSFVLDNAGQEGGL